MFTKKFLISLIISCGILLSVNAIGFTAANPFRDVPAGHWAYNAVIKLAREGIFNGYGDGTFRGNRNITRYEAATFLARVMATFKSNNFSEKLKFTDVPNNHWAYNYVVFVAKNGINKGYDDNTFRGERYITRYEMAQMIANFLEISIESNRTANPFSDVTSSHWAVDAVINLTNKGIINGYGDGTFRGNRNITRYEAAIMVARAEAIRAN